LILRLGQFKLSAAHIILRIPFHGDGGKTILLQLLVSFNRSFVFGIFDFKDRQFRVDLGQFIIQVSDLGLQAGFQFQVSGCLVSHDLFSKSGDDRIGSVGSFLRIRIGYRYIENRRILDRRGFDAAGNRITQLFGNCLQ